MSDAGKDETLCEGKHIRLLRRDTYEFASRKKASGIVAIVAANAEGKMLLIEQFRPPVGHRVIEIPAGLVGDVAGQEQEDLATAAQRELLEETGYQAETLEAVGKGPPSAGICDEIITIFVARGLRKTREAVGDGSEDITLHEVPVGEVPAFLERKAAESCLIDLKVYCGLYFLKP
jgi:ADP-ribose pyrophosphatase